MTVTLNESALSALLDAPDGPVGQMLARKAEQVEAFARENANGPLIGVRSGDLLAGLHASPVERDGDGLRVRIGTSARHRGFAYPAFHDLRGTPRGRWLTEALARVFSAARVTARV